MFYFQEVTSILSLLVLLSHVFILLALGAHFSKKPNKLTKWISKHVLLLSFIVALTAVAGSLYYSDIAGLPPCKLCWYQRIFVYPLLFIYGLALKKKDRGAVSYGLLLSGVGALIALYHYGIQISQTLAEATSDLVPCSIVGMTPSCSSYFFLEFGYITIPMMSLTAAVLIFTLGLVSRKS